MKCVMIFLVLTLVVLMAEPGESRSRFGRFVSGVYRGIKEGARGKSQVFIHTELTLTDRPQIFTSK
uniref:Uncharacterized protein n=1 Tax=Sparus aurata TaxID=8175 RepID=A0A671VQ70_SPAAU